MSTLDGAATTRGNRRGRPRDTSADKRIRRAAEELLLERGYDKMTVDDVAERAGVGKATVYRRYATKEAMALAAMYELFAIDLPAPDTGSLREDLTQMYQDTLDFVTSPPGQAFVRLAVSESCRDPRIAEAYRAMLNRRLDGGRVVFERAIARGELRPDVDLDVLGEWLLGLIVLRSVVRGQNLGPADVPGLLDMTLYGVHA